MRDEQHSDSLSHDYSRLSTQDNTTALENSSPVSSLASPVQLHKQEHPSISNPRSPSLSVMEADTSGKNEAKGLQKRMPRAPPASRSTRFGWWWETASVILSIACTAGIVGLLVHVDDKPLMHWKITGKKSTPNVLVAILSTVAKSALLFPLAECLGQLKWTYFETRARPVNHLQVFDGATRGPWGSFLFLLEVRGKAILASLGAVVTLLALSFDPFTQLAIDYTGRLSQIGNENGSLSVSHKWLNGNDGGTSPADYNLYIPVTAGVLTALGNKDYAPSPNYECPRFKCQADDVAILGVCSQCNTQTIINTKFDDCQVDFRYELNGGPQDPDINQGTYQDLLDRLSNLETEGLDYNLNMLCEQRPTNFPSISLNLNMVPITGYDTPSGGLMQPPPYRGAYGLTQEIGWVHPPSSPSLLINRTDGVDNATLRFCTFDRTDGNFNGIVQQPAISLIKASCFTSTTDLTLYHDILKVGQINGTLHTCDLQLCEKYYESITVQSGIKTYTKLKQNNLMPQERADSDNRRHLSAVADSGSNASYDIGFTAWNEMQDRFIKANPTDTNTTNNETDWNIVHNILRPTSRTNGSATDNFPLLFDRFADILTFVIQSSDNPDRENMSMTVSDTVPYVVVRWGYMAMPLAIVFFAALLLIISIVESRKDYLLKTSTLAVMYHGLDARDWVHEPEDAQGIVRTKATDNDLFQEAKEINAVFVHDEGHMKLKRE